MSAYDKVRLDLGVVGGKTEIAEFLLICRAIQLLGTTGSSREFRVYVDGDGSARLRFYFGDEQLGYDGLTVDDVDEHRFSIGE